LVLEIDDTRKGYRSRLEIIRDILLVTRDTGSKKTRIMYGANLSYKLVTRYLDELMKAGFLMFDGESLYTLTSRAQEFLKTYEAYEKNNRELERHLKYSKSGRDIMEKMLSAY